MGDDLFNKENLQKTFGLVLRRHRKAMNISQEKLALECGLDRSFVGMLERGQRTPSLRTIFIVAAHLKTTPAKLVREVEKALKN